MWQPLWRCFRCNRRASIAWRLCLSFPCRTCCTTGKAASTLRACCLPILMCFRWQISTFGQELQVVSKHCNPGFFGPPYGAIPPPRNGGILQSGLLWTAAAFFEPPDLWPPVDWWFRWYFLDLLGELILNLLPKLFHQSKSIKKY